MSSGMNTEQAKEYAKTMTYREAVSNVRFSKGIKYRKATMIKLRELAIIADRLDRKDEPTTQTETQNSNLTFEKDECAKEYEELGLKELKELINADRKTEPQTDLLVTEYPQDGEVYLIGRDKTEAVVMAYDVYKELTESQTDYKMPYEDCEDCETHLKAQMERRSDEQ